MKTGEGLALRNKLVFTWLDLLGLLVVLGSFSQGLGSFVWRFIPAAPPLTAALEHLEKKASKSNKKSSTDPLEEKTDGEKTPRASGFRSRRESVRRQS